MIDFRCWYCSKRYVVPERRIGERFDCACKNLLRVPKRNDGNCRVKKAADWLVEAVVYGGGGAFLGLGLGLLILSHWRPLVGLLDGWVFVAGLAAVGFLAGLFGGERGVNWVGRRIRDRENR